MKPIFDFEAIKKNRINCARNFAAHDFLFKAAADRLMDNLADIQRDFNNILIIGWRGADYLRGALEKYNAKITIGDIVFPSVRDNQLAFEIEIPDLPAQAYDCILALPSLHVVNDVPGFLLQVKKALKPDGVFLCSLFGGETLKELRDGLVQSELQITGGAAQRVHPMIDHYQMAALMQRADFALPVVDFDRVHVSYKDLSRLFDDIKGMGEGNVLCDRGDKLGNDLKNCCAAYYKNHYHDDDGYHATFDIVHAIGWAHHSSQQQPARRGSGEKSLTEVL